jgi:hypothetical protein
MTHVAIDDDIWLWSSGHRLNRTVAESWATASVFEFAQSFRRLIGIWTREIALEELPAAASESVSSGLKILRARGKTWTRGEAFADQVESLFVNPQNVHSNKQTTDPDIKLIPENCARSAILFGPAGASKTTVVRNVASAIKWDYVELHSSHFVADGMPAVQRTADQIFRRLYELDRAVILFDEIDELVRERDEKSESYGRFLTTSMLPRLAELWKSRRVLYFVATNHIEYFDRAITRAERFDAVWFMSPPSFEEKVKRIEEILEGTHQISMSWKVQKSDIDRAFPEPAAGNNQPQRLEKANMLAKFALLRWDELDELAFDLAKESRASEIEVDPECMAKALGRVTDKSWRPVNEYLKFKTDQDYGRRDFGKLNYWRVADGSDTDALGVLLIGTDVKYLKYAADEAGEISLPGYVVSRSGPAEISIKKMP